MATPHIYIIAVGFFIFKNEGMKKPIIFSVFFFIITTTPSLSQGVWIEERPGLEEGLREGKIKINGNIYDIEPRAILSGANLEGADLSLSLIHI